MAKYRAEVTIAHKGEIVKPGEEIQLTEEQAERLHSKGFVSAVDEEGVSLDTKVHEESEFRALKADEQKAVVVGLKGNTDELTNEDLRWEYVEAHQ